MAEPTAFQPDAPGWGLLETMPCETCHGVGCLACNGWGRHYLRPPRPATPDEPPPDPDAAADLVDAIGNAAEDALRKLGLRR